MDASLIIGIIGTVATIVFGFLTIDLLKRKKYPGRLAYIKLSVVDLLNNVANNFNEIELLHNKQPINKNLIYIKGALLNNGDIDINSKVTEKDITMELPEGCKWLDVKSTDCSDGLNASLQIESEQKACFKFDLFRKDEFVQFEGLVESESNEISSDEINSDLVFTHRIENTSRIEKKTLLTKKEIKKKKRNAIIYSIGLLLFLLVFTAEFVFNLFGTRKEGLYYKNLASNNELVYSVKQNNGTILLSSIQNGEEIETNLQDFNAEFCATKYEMTFWEKFKDSYWMISFQFGLFVVIVLWELLEIRKAKKLSRILYEN